MDYLAVLTKNLEATGVDKEDPSGLGTIPKAFDPITNHLKKTGSTGEDRWDNQGWKAWMVNPGSQQGNPMWKLMNPAQVAQVKATSYLIRLYGWDDYDWGHITPKHKGVALQIFAEGNVINAIRSTKKRIKEWNSVANGERQCHS